MTDFARCKDCRAITLDTDDDIRAHRIWHRDLDAKHEGTRRVASEAKDSLGKLRDEIAHYGQQLAAQPIPEPDQITVHEMPDDDELGLDEPDVEQQSQHLDDEQTDDADEPDDDLEPAPAAHQTAVDYFTPRPLT